LALFAVLFTDGMHVSFPKLRANWRNPARALGLGMPLAVIGMALLTHYLVGLDWTSFLVGAVLAPTDPVFASAIVGRIAHSSTDVPIARLFRFEDVAGIPADNDDVASVASQRTHETGATGRG
jgi:NhaP-type Na+/H+ or K+/H+ antiporter